MKIRPLATTTPTSPPPTAERSHETGTQLHLPGIMPDSRPGRQDPTITLGAVDSIRKRAPNAAIDIDKKSSAATFLSGSLLVRGGPGVGGADTPVDPAHTFLKEHGLLFGVSSPGMLKQVDRTEDELGFVHTRYQQQYRGLPVFGQELIVHHRGDEITSVGGRIVPNIDTGTEPTLDADAALKAVSSKTPGRPTKLDQELGIYTPDGAEPRLAWRLDLDGIDADGAWRYMVDAQDGTVLDRWTLHVPAMKRETYDAKNHWMVPGELVRKEGQKATGDKVVDAAHDNAGKVYQFLKERHGRDSFDGKGGKLVSVTHFRDGYNNAQWDGTKMIYGDGDGKVFTPFPLALDVVAHEFFHGVTDNSADLVYLNQSGALNEHFSDVFGELVEQWSEGTAEFPKPPKTKGIASADAVAGAMPDAPTEKSAARQAKKGAKAAKPDWMIGEDVFTPGKKGDALRNMAAPGTAHPGDPQPAHMRDYVETDEDWGGVHINSGIPNKAAHTVATTAGVDVLDQVWYRALTKYLTPRANFRDAANSTVQAARDIYGEASEAVTAIEKAWESVGIETAKPKK